MIGEEHYKRGTLRYEREGGERGQEIGVTVEVTADCVRR